MAYVSNNRSLAETAPSKSAPSDVFISHSKHPLAGLIAEKLEAMGVKVFGNSEELQLASLYFIIFSKEHAQSSRCLEELTFIRKRIRIVPIFYQVKTEDVRYLKGAYRSAFDRYKTEGKHTSKKLHKWKKVLFRVSHNIGPIVNNKNEDMLLKKIPNWLVKEAKFLPVEVEGFSPSIYASGGSKMSVNDHSELKAFLVRINRRMKAEGNTLEDCLRVVKRINDYLDPLARQIKERSAYVERMEGTIYYFRRFEGMKNYFLPEMEKAEEAYLGIMEKAEETYLGIMKKDEEIIPVIIKNDRRAFLATMERIREALMADTVEKKKAEKTTNILWRLCDYIFEEEITVEEKREVLLKALGLMTIDSLEWFTERLEKRLRKCNNEIKDLSAVVTVFVAPIEKHGLKKLLKWKKSLHKVSQNKEGEDIPGSYDVFINHRGPDVKQTLAKSMYKDLKEMGLKPFLDSEELRWGDHVPSVLETVMKRAKVHIAIFSMNYAESKWCLRELAFMKSNTRAQIIPIFNHVEPEHVRYRKGVFGDAFHRMKEKGRFTSKQLQKWKGTLFGVSWHLGPILHSKKDEDMLLRNIPSVCKGFVKLNERMQDTRHKGNSILKLLLSLFKI